MEEYTDKEDNRYDNKEKILSLVREKGPLLPSDIYKELDTSVLFASAMLGELVSKNLLKLTSLKRGSSPYYYLPGQEPKLENLNQFLNEKEKRAYVLLKEKGILRDLDMPPQVRVSLRAIKDYALPLQVNYNDKTEIFWKWFLLPKEEAEETIKEILKIKKTPVKKIKETMKKMLKTKEKPKKDLTDASSQFIEQISGYFKNNNITVLSKEIIRKKSEIDYSIELQSAVGTLKYYCKAKNKKKINDSDLASAYVQGQQKKLPVLLLITGELTKRAKEMLDKEFKGLTIKKI